jgi:Uma2 family endonuclease
MSTPVVPSTGHEPFGVVPADLHPCVDHLVTEDDTPVDSIYSEKQERLLANSLYTSWSGFGELPIFVALANVGLFYDRNQPPVVPDFLLSLGVRIPDDLKVKRHRSYFVWEYQKYPELLIEVVSNTEGEELGNKKRLYAQLGIPIYAVWDPFKIISQTRLQVFGLNAGTYEPIPPGWIPKVGLGLTIWAGKFEGVDQDWLRWCNQQGALLLTGEERAQIADERAERLAAQIRKLGIEPADGND